MPDKHALLSSSSAHRWLNCQPSARLCEAIEDTPSDYAIEGTDAHSLCEYKLKKALDIECTDPTENLTYYNEKMDESAEGYKDLILEVLEEIKKDGCKDPIVLIEQKLDFSKWVPEGFGTGDCVIVADKKLYVVDFKFGKGVMVSAHENPQMMLYGLGALELFDALYDIDKVHLIIYQPRLSNVSEYEMSKEDLLKWADEVLVPKAKLAYEGRGEFACGEWCQFCKVRSTCRKRAEASLALAAFDFKKPPLLENSEIEEILPKLDQMTSWAEDIKAYALGMALSGHKWKGWKVVEGRSIRKYKDEKLVASTVASEGYDPFEKKLLGITEMQKLLGKTKFEEILGGLVIKPQGKPALVKESDKRPEFMPATADFVDEEK